MSRFIFLKRKKVRLTDRILKSDTGFKTLQPKSGQVEPRGFCKCHNKHKMAFNISAIPKVIKQIKNETNIKKLDNPIIISAPSW